MVMVASFDGGDVMTFGRACTLPIPLGLQNLSLSRGGEKTSAVLVDLGGIYQVLLPDPQIIR